MPQGAAILIVEDNDDLRIDLEEMFSLEGFEVLTASDAIEALKLLAHSTVNAVISDYEMPKMNGGELLRRLRADKRTAHLPFVLITGGYPPVPEDDVRFYLLRKPFAIEELLRLIKLYLSQGQRPDYSVAD